MAARVRKAVLLGFLIGTIGSALGFTELGMALEEAVGLDWLFSIRGPVDPAPDAIVIAMDRRSSLKLKQSYQLRNWQRSLHAELIDKLVEWDASVVVFDLFFEEVRTASDAKILADAMERSKRIVLMQSAQQETLEGLVLHRLLDPPPQLATAAAGLAPFPLPKVPNRVSQFWAFFDSVSETPTLPVVALLMRALQSLDYTELVKLMERAGFQHLSGLPSELTNAHDLQRVMEDLRFELKTNPELADGFLKAVNTAGTEVLSAEAKRFLIALARVHSGKSSYFLNFYGPPQTVTTVSYSAFWSKDYNAELLTPLNLAGKVVFIGESETASANHQNDGFFTVFSREDGIDLSGVEIAATAYLNLLNDQTLQPLGILSNAVLLFVFGSLVGFVGYFLPGARVGIALLILAVLYYGAAEWLFISHFVWIPVFVPLALQMPLALLLGLFWQYLVTKKERENASRAIRYYVPERVAQRLMRDGNPETDSDLVYGICLFTDVEGYTTLSETLNPQQLAGLAKEYFQAVGECIAMQQGEMLDIAGDGMVCVWTAQQPSREVRLHACLAAIEIRHTVARFNERHPSSPFPTRQGLQAGWMMMGNVGGGGHLMYGVTGDIPNTASRIEGLNKRLGTQILAAEPAVGDLDELLIRRTGSFVLKGKSETLSIFEVIGNQDNVRISERRLCEQFAAALGAFEAGHWAKACHMFEAILAVYPLDGPSRFYQRLCHQYCIQPPLRSEEWNIIRIETK